MAAPTPAPAVIQLINHLKTEFFPCQTFSPVLFSVIFQLFKKIDAVLAKKHLLYHISCLENCLISSILPGAGAENVVQVRAPAPAPAAQHCAIIILGSACHTN